MPGPSPQKAVIRPSGIKYNSAIRVMSKPSRSAKKAVVMEATNPSANRYFQILERKEKLRMGAEFIIPFWIMQL